MSRRSIWRELRRRHVYRVAAAYAVVGWLLIEVATQIFPVFHIPDWAAQLVVLVILIGFPIAVVLAWAFEVTPEGVRRTQPVDSPDARAPEQHRRVGRQLDYIIIAVLALAVAVLLWRQFGARGPSSSGIASAAAASKSIAVLPFENLSTDKANAFFADGIQDEILTGLAKVGDLKVISRTSTQRYKSKPDNIPEIAQQLGVGNILEGSVQKAGDRVRINVQLINALTDSHRWAETYDRTLNDVFAVQSEVAEKIAASLKAQLTGSERAELAAKPTDNPQAYEAFLQSRAVGIRGYDLDVSRNACQLLVKATRLDPKFVQAWSDLAQTASYLYGNGVDPSDYTADFIKHAVDMVSQLKPDSIEALLAQGNYRYRVLVDFPGADKAFRAALAKSPHNVDGLRYLGFVERREGKWDEALRHLLQAADRDPRNPGLMTTIGGETLSNMRRWDDARMWLDRALAISPDSTLALSYKILSYQLQGRLPEAAKLLHDVPESGEDAQIAWVRSYQSLLERHYDKAATELQAVLAQPESALNGWGPQLAINLGYAQLWAGDKTGAHNTLERLVKQLQPHATTVNDSMMPIVLAQAYAGLGENQRALEQGHRALELYRDDSIYAPLTQIVLAQIQAMSGDHAAAIAALPELLKVPGGVTLAQLKLDPFWDPLRKDAAFRKLVSENGT